MNKENKEVHGTPRALGFVAVFLAGVTVATAVAVLATRNQAGKVAKSTESVLSACDRAMQKLEQRVQAVDAALVS